MSMARRIVSNTGDRMNQGLNDFQKRFEEARLYFAYHAAFPLSAHPGSDLPAVASRLSTLDVNTKSIYRESVSEN